MKKGLWKKGLVFGIIVLFVGASVTPSICGNLSDKENGECMRDNISLKATIYVPDDYPTIQGAVDAAASGYTIIVRDGNYTENINIDKDNLTIQSENGPFSTIVQAVNSNDDVFEISADDVTINGFTIQGATASIEDAGIYLYYGEGCRFTSNICRDNFVGIALWTSSNNRLDNNSCSWNIHSGIALGYSSSYNIIENNTCCWTQFGGIAEGILLGSWSHHNTIRNNNCSNNDFAGIAFSQAPDNIIIKNTFYGNLYGVYLHAASISNTFYLNNFISNTNNAFSDESAGDWNSLILISYSYSGNTYTSYMGNYWDDYIGIDADGDGIGDSPYSIYGDYDNYPLMEPFENYFKGSETQTITRIKIIKIAEAYANHEWYPTEDNIYHDVYGGKRVDTPDRDTYESWPEEVGWKSNELNVSVPYQWGGFSSLSGLDLFPQEDFDEQYTGTGAFAGVIHFAGDINYTGGECKRACGVDCSGFVSRCWNLSNKYSTNTLPYVSHQIKYDSLKPGDILDKPEIHVILFKEYANENRTLIRTIEANGDPEVGGVAKVIEKEYTVEVSDDGLNVTLDADITYKLYSYKFISNSPPYVPTINGSTSGKTGVEYEYTFIAEDIDDDNVYYLIDWGDESPMDWIGPYNSSEEITLSHSWDIDGTYAIKAKVKDVFDEESDWGNLEVTMPRSKPFFYNSPLLNWLIERFPIIQRLLIALGVNIV